MAVTCGAARRDTSAPTSAHVREQQGDIVIIFIGDASCIYRPHLCAYLCAFVRVCVCVCDFPNEMFFVAI